MATCEHMDDCKISTSECNRLSARLMRAKKRCFEPPESASSSRSTVAAGYVVGNLTEREKALLAYAYSAGYEMGHHDTVEGGFWGDGRFETHLETATEWLEELSVDDMDYAVDAYRKVAT